MTKKITLTHTLTLTLTPSLLVSACSINKYFLKQADKAEAQLKMAESIEGAKIRAEYVHSGKEKKEEKRQRIETINGLLEQRRKELEAATGGTLILFLRSWPYQMPKRRYFDKVLT